MSEPVIRLRLPDAPRHGVRVIECENLWWRHWRWEAFYGSTGFKHGIAATADGARRKGRAALSQLVLEGHR